MTDVLSLLVTLYIYAYSHGYQSVQLLADFVLTHFEFAYVFETYGRSHDDSIYRASMASRGKNEHAQRRFVLPRQI